MWQSGRYVVAVDLPGHEPGSSHDPAAYADLARQLANRLPAGRIDAVGFSLGGKLLLQLAAEQPARFRRLAIAGVGANIFGAENGSLVSEVLLNGATDQTPPALRQVVDAALASGNDPLALSAVIRRTPRLVRPADLEHVWADILLITGSDDVIAGPADALADALPRVHTVVIDGLDHHSTPCDPQFQTHAAAFVLGPADP